MSLFTPRIPTVTTPNHLLTVATSTSIGKRFYRASKESFKAVADYYAKRAR